MDTLNDKVDTVEPVWLPNGTLNPVIANKPCLEKQQSPIGPFLPSAEYLLNIGYNDLLVDNFAENDPTPLLSLRTKTGKTQVYVGLGKYIDYSTYILAKSKTPARLFRCILRFHYAKEQLANRCLFLNRVYLEIRNAASPRKIVTPKKLKIIEDVFTIFLDQKGYTECDKINYKNKIRKYLSKAIRDAVRSVNTRRKLNYEM